MEEVAEQWDAGFARRAQSTRRRTIRSYVEENDSCNVLVPLEVVPDSVPANRRHVLSVRSTARVPI